MDTETCWLNLCLAEQVLFYLDVACLVFGYIPSVVFKFWGPVKLHMESVGPVLTSPK